MFGFEYGGEIRECEMSAPSSLRPCGNVTSYRVSNGPLDGADPLYREVWLCGDHPLSQVHSLIASK